MIQRFLANQGTILVRGFSALLILALFAGHIPIASAASYADRVHPSLRDMASNRPGETVRIIVQELNAKSNSQALVPEYGGRVIRELKIINAYVAEMPANMIPKLGLSDQIRWISPDADVVETSQKLQFTDNVHDDFSQPSYAGSSGSVNWLSEWQEIGESDGPELSDVTITRYMGGQEQGLRIQSSSKGAMRSVNLATAYDVKLEFNYRRKNFSDTYFVKVEVSSDAGKTWIEVGRLVGAGTDADLQSASYDISDFASTDTKIRFVSSQSDEGRAKLYIDNVDVSFTSATKSTTSPPQMFYFPFLPSHNQKVFVAEPNVNSVRAASGTLTILDTFSTNGYGGNDGTSNWASNWVENDDSGGGASSGEIYVQSGSTNCPSGAGCLIFDPDEEDDYVVRSADLSSASSATLSYDYNATQFNTSGLAEFEIQIKDASGAWHELAKFESESNDRTIEAEVGTCSGDPIGSCSHDITPYMNTDYTQPTQIRILVTEENSNEPIGWDNFQIEYASGGTPATATPVGSGTISDQFSTNGYGGNDGTSNWVSDWVENDDSGGGASGGEIYVQNGSTNCPSGAGCLIFDPDEEYDYVVRSADLSGASSATLSYEYNATQFNTSSEAEFEIQIKDAAGAWQKLATFESESNDRTIEAQVGSCSGDPIGSCAHDITPYLNTDSAQPTQIRIIVTEANSNEPIGWDNFQIEYSTLANLFVKAIGADQLWYESTPLDGQQVTIAVVDSGIVDHDDFLDDDGTSRILQHINFNNSGSSDDFYGHGTHVAGVIAGNGDKSDGARAGVAPRADLIDVKVTDDYGAGTTSDVIAGLQWIHDHKETYNIRVVNISLNSTVAESYHLSPLNAALEILWFNGIVVVVSAGNNGLSNNGILFAPANDPFLITVGAVDDGGTPDYGDNVVASFSAYGTTLDGFAKPDLVAPGVDIIAALASDDSNLVLDHPAHAVAGASGNHYFRMSGTSMASAVIAGAVALLLQDEPTLTPDQVKYRLMTTAKSNWPGYDQAKAGAGLLDIKAAVNGNSTASANTGVQASQLLWTGSDPVTWGSVNWGSVNWGSVNWGSVNWGSVNWGSVNWDD